LNLRAQLVRQCAGPLAAASHLPDGYSLELVSDRPQCEHCGGPLRRIRTSTHRPVGLMLGRPRVRRVQKSCARCGQIDSLDGYRQLVPPQGNYAYDLMVEVGLARLRDLRQDAEIQQDLPRRWTLEVAKMTTENASEISQPVPRSVKNFGTPLAVMRDLSKNIQAAKNEVIPDVPDLICHYHFLENVGTKLCEKPHVKLTKALRRLKIRPALKWLRKDLVRWSKRRESSLSPERIERLLSHPDEATELDAVTLRRLVAYVLLRWLDDYGADLHGEYFPFDPPSLAFYRRGRQLSE